MTSLLRQMALVVCLGLVLLAGAGLAPGAADAEDQDPLATARMYQTRARKLGAKGTLPAAWSAFDKRLDDAEGMTRTGDELADLEAEGRHLVARAAFLREVKETREPLESLLGRFDRALAEVATTMDLDLDPLLTGDQAAERLLALLGADRLQRQVYTDSLRVENRRLTELAVGHTAAQDSIITRLRVELSAVRQRLWETELRAGMAEADRSAAESALSVRQAREEAVRRIKADLGKDGGDVLTTADGSIVVQVPGLEFKVGDAHLAPGQAELMNLLADIVGRFRGAAVRVEGHTDDTGSRAANLKLSQRRAATVAGGIERRLELPEGSVVVEGFGPDRPVAPNSTAAGRARNRRIDVVITPAG